MASAVDNVTVKLGSQTSSSQFFVKDSNDAAVLTVNADNTTAINGTLSVSGATTMSSTLSVTGAATVGGATTLGGALQVTGDITDNNSGIVLNDSVVITGDVTDNNSAITLDDDVIITGAITDNNSAVFINDDVYVTGTVSDNSSSSGTVTVQQLAGSRVADISLLDTDTTLSVNTGTILLKGKGGAVLPASATPGIMYTIIVASDNATAVSLKTAATTVSVTTVYHDNDTTVAVKSDNSTGLDNSTITLCIAATANFYQCLSQGGTGTQ
jgi:formylmethanofuran dehydrogenase subunit C